MATWALKKFFRPTLLIVVLITLLLALFTRQKPVFQAQPKNKPVFGLPIELTIPVINVNAKIQSLDVTPNGEMAVPDNIVDVGWFKLGPRPGEKGSAVIAGHFNGKNDKIGVFANLYKLKIGDKLYLKDDTGASLAFVVRNKRLYGSRYADDVFSQNDGAHLNLITCDGVWNEAKKSYSQRLVVFTDILK